MSEELCREVVISVIAGASWIPCALPKGHEGGHRGKGNCCKHGEYLGEVGAFPQCPSWPDCVAYDSIKELMVKQEGGDASAPENRRSTSPTSEAVTAASSSRDGEAVQYVIVADGEGAEARIVQGDIHQAVHDFMCFCGEPWVVCQSLDVRRDVQDIDDVEQWVSDEAHMPFAIHWRSETGTISLYRLSAEPNSLREVQPQENPMQYTNPAPLSLSDKKHIIAESQKESSGPTEEQVRQAALFIDHHYTWDKSGRGYIRRTDHQLVLISEVAAAYGAEIRREVSRDYQQELFHTEAERDEAQEHVLRLIPERDKAQRELATARTEALAELLEHSKTWDKRSNPLSLGEFIVSKLEEMLKG